MGNSFYLYFVFIFILSSLGLAQENPIAWMPMRTDSKPLNDVLQEVLTDVGQHKTAWGSFGKTSDGKAAMQTEDPSTGYASCFNYKEIKFSFICVFNSQRFMSDVIGRGYDQITKKTETDRAHLLNIHIHVQGYHASPEAILEISKTIQDPQSHDVTEGETEFLLWEYVQLRLEKENLFFKYFAQPVAAKGYEVIAIHNEATPDRVTQFLSHELMHTQWHSAENYAMTVVNYWNSMEPEERKGIVNDLVAHGYQFSNKLDMVNEFQAYMLQGSDRSILGKWAAKHREGLRKALANAGINVFYFSE